MRDVTDEAVLEAKFHQSQKMEVVGRLAAGVAHDFNNLLHVIDGYGDMLRRTLEPGHEGHAHLDQILSASERACLLTQRLLAFSRKQDLQMKTFDVNAAVRDSARTWVRLLGEDVRLVMALAPDAGWIRADPGQFDQVLMNLAVNARDAMPGGGTLTVATGELVVSAEAAAAHPGVAPGPFVRISVMDTGVGMDAATKARIFEPFFTTKGPGKGSGLGLATVYGIVEQCGGFVEVESEFGRGAAFHVHLPRADNGSGGALDREAPRESSAPRGSETVVVAEDDRAVRTLMVGVLRGAGYAVTECEGAEEAASAASLMNRPLSILVTDVVMPDGGGAELAQRVCAWQPSARTLFVSGYSAETLDRHGLRADETDILAKPFSPDALLRRVRGVLDAPRRPLAVGT
jgi:nitrogen-specific signal transduction histidine kinase/ActR/RegA family two-component response regulator